MKTIYIKYFNTDMTPIDYIGAKSDWIDLRAADDVALKRGEFKLIPLGVAMELPKRYEAHIVPRSSTFKNYGVIQTNGVGIIDADYYNNADNEGHIMLALLNMGQEKVVLPKGERVAQGIFYTYLTADGDEKIAKSVRGGGFGSTSK